MAIQPSPRRQSTNAYYSTYVRTRSARHDPTDFIKLAGAGQLGGTWTPRGDGGAERLTDSGQSLAPARAAVPAHAAVVATSVSATDQHFRERLVVRGDVCVLLRQDPHLRAELLLLRLPGGRLLLQGRGVLLVLRRVVGVARGRTVPGPREPGTALRSCQSSGVFQPRRASRHDRRVRPARSPVVASSRS